MPQDAPGTYGTNALVAPSVEQVAVLGSTVPPSEGSQCLNDENNVMQVQNPLRINTSFASAADPFPTQAAGAEVVSQTLTPEQYMQTTVVPSTGRSAPIDGAGQKRPATAMNGNSEATSTMYENFLRDPTAITRQPLSSLGNTPAAAPSAAGTATPDAGYESPAKRASTSTVQSYYSRKLITNDIVPHERYFLAPSARCVCGSTADAHSSNGSSGFRCSTFSIDASRNVAIRDLHGDIIAYEAIDKDALP